MEKRSLSQRVADALCNIRVVEKMTKITWIANSYFEDDVRHSLVMHGLCEWKRDREGTIIGVHLTDPGREAANDELERRSVPRG